MTHNFDQWNCLKKELNNFEIEKRNLPTFQDREIWWCRIGLNVGHEENGKGKDYSRPVLVLRKFNKNLFLAVPLTTKIKDKHYYHKIYLKGDERCVIVSQIRLLSSNRLMNKIERLSFEQFLNVKEAVKKVAGLV